MLLGVDGEAPAAQGRRNQTAGLIETHGVDPNTGGLRQFRNSKFHVLTLRVNALNVESLLQTESPCRFGKD
jgi:hypothetical protein